MREVSHHTQELLELLVSGILADFLQEKALP